MASYENAPATAMVATQCACCGRPLLDATSVEAGIGPDCRKKYGYGEAQGLPDWAKAMEALDGFVAVADANPMMTPRAVCNLLVYRFACSVMDEEQAMFVIAIAALGYQKLAGKLAEAAGKVEVVVRPDGRLGVKTPYRPEFVAGLKAARVGARWDAADKVWTVPPDGPARAGLWRVLRQTFAGAFLVSEKGTTRIEGLARAA